MKNKKIIITIIIVLIIMIILLTGIIILINKKESKEIKIEEISEETNKKTSEETIEPIVNDKSTNLEKTNDIKITPTMNDKITADSSWCGTFQLVWNDMKNEVVKQDVIFNPQIDMVKNLNKEDFNESMLSEDYYFKTYGLKTLELKEQIEKGIKEKFNQTSDILEDFDWSEKALNDPNNPNIRRYFFYTMLYRKFEFLKNFDVLDNDNFGKEYKDIEYFGINEATEDSVGDQITVLYYNSKDDFAIQIATKTDDEVIFCKNPKGSNFNEIYENMNNEAKKYTGKKAFNKIDEFKAPKLTLNEKKDYTELEGKEFKTANMENAEIEKAIQTIQISLDEKGGEIKSEAAIDMTLSGFAGNIEPKKEEPRYFFVDDTFTIFLREKGKTKPYFASRINDITKFQ